MFVDLKTMRGTPALKGIADEMAQELASSGTSSSAAGKAVVEAIEVMLVSSDPLLILFEGRFQEFQGPFLQASFAAASTKQESYRGTTLFTMQGAILGFPTASTWLISDSVDVAKMTIDIIAERPASTDSRRAATLARIGPGYLVLLASPEGLEGSESTTGLATLKGLSYAGYGMAVADQADSRVRALLHFDTAANAAAAELELRQPGVAAKAIGIQGATEAIVERSNETVFFEFKVSHSSVAQQIREG